MENEGDNEKELCYSLVDDLPWAWQVVNGYCNYAALTTAGFESRQLGLRLRWRGGP